MPVNAVVLDLPGADVVLYPSFFPAEIATKLFETLRYEIAWRQDDIRLFGRKIAQPRLTAWHGDPERCYTYSGLTMRPEPWTPTLDQIRHAVENASDDQFNSVLLNLYRNERDSNAWHSDDERELGSQPTIASVSLGAMRRFQFRHKTERERRLSMDLSHGDLLIMRADTQRNWQHQLPKSTRPCGERINLTFRRILGPGKSG
jgi:alkylated DNA repair dioxygenase AlkB